MSSINSIGGNNPVQKIIANPIQKQIPPQKTETVERGGDKVELSSVQGYLQTLKANDVRNDKIATIKQQIESGTYESDDKLNAAIDKLLDEIG